MYKIFKLLCNKRGKNVFKRYYITEKSKIYTSIVGERPVYIKQVPNMGRGVFAMRDFERTETIHTEVPPIVVPSFSRRKHVCRSCLVDMVSLPFPFFPSSLKNLFP